MNTVIQELFSRVAELSPADRERYFDANQVDLSTRKRIAILIEHHSSTAVTLPRQLTGIGVRQSIDSELPSLLCGPYQLKKLLGSGGFGTVYLAERVDGEVCHRVAIKLLRPEGDGVGSGSLVAERRILANLSHPNIARLLDTGQRPDGQQFLVIEYVEGQTIDLCTSALSIRSTLELFLKVCSAVSYLHRNLVVHRDLKPTNILVTAEGEPKLVDFGIAKMLNLTTDYLLTATPLLTPEYASPEQSRSGARRSGSAKSRRSGTSHAKLSKGHRIRKQSGAPRSVKPHRTRFVPFRVCLSSNAERPLRGGAA